MTSDYQVAVAVPRRKDGKFLILKRASDKKSPEKWIFPGGSIEEGETPDEAVLRGLKEETSLEGEIVKETESFPREVRGINHSIYCYLIDITGEVKLNEENQDFSWIGLEELNRYDIVGEFEGLIRLDVVNGRVALPVARNDDELLLVKRSEENTSSGKWSFVSGRVEEDENFEEAAVRELDEEVDLSGEVVEVGECYISEGETGYWVVHPVLVDVDSRDVELNWELSEYQWIKPEELEDFETLGDGEALERLEAGNE